MTRRRAALVALALVALLAAAGCQTQPRSSTGFDRWAARHAPIILVWDGHDPLRLALNFNAQEPGGWSPALAAGALDLDYYRGNVPAAVEALRHEQGHAAALAFGFWQQMPAPAGTSSSAANRVRNEEAAQCVALVVTKRPLYPQSAAAVAAGYWSCPPAYAHLVLLALIVHGAAP